MDDLYQQTQLRMGKWLNDGLWMPIDNINNGKSRDLLNHLIGRKYVYGDSYSNLTDEQKRILRMLLSSNGYACFRALLLQRGEFNGTNRTLPDQKTSL